MATPSSQNSKLLLDMDYEAARQKLLDRLVEGVIDDDEFEKRKAAIDRAEAAERSKGQAFSTPAPVMLNFEVDREGVTTPLVVGPGFSLGKYVLRESLGAGGMGFIWAAYDTVGEREVALKILPQALQQQPAELERFRKTFQLVERLHHSHICPLYELAHFPHPAVGWYQVMRLICGRTLQEFCDNYRAKRGDLPVDLVVQLLEPVARALDDAHARKIVHRDIKPENILVEGKGLAIDHVWLIDFGIAAEIRSTMTRASTSDTVETWGSRGYLAPELFQAHYPDAFSDQYALAVVAYELFAGKLPFQSDDFLVLRQAVLEQPVPAVDGVPEPVMSVLRLALAKQPSERFASCCEFVQRLARPGEAVSPIMPVATTAPTITAPAQLDDGAILSEEQDQQAVDNPPNQKPAATPKPQVNATFSGTKAGEVRTFTDQGIKFCWCPAGEFLMGSPKSDDEAWDDERPQHRVTLTVGFWLGQTPVTQEEWEALMGSDPSSFERRQNPVVGVSWKEAADYCSKLTAAEQAAGRLPSDWSYRLPSEAEWEYACRAGTTTQYCFGDRETQLGKYAWFDENSDDMTRPVGRKRPNRWGLLDMHGNVWEWCSDWSGAYEAGAVTDPRGPSTGSLKVNRGGCYGGEASNCRSAFRGGDFPLDRFINLGFRVALGLRVASPRSADSVQATPEPLPVVLPSEVQRKVDSTNIIQSGTTAGEVGSFTDHQIKFCWCPPGSFQMGSSASDRSGYVSDQPQHHVTLTQGFWLGQTEVTQEQWRKVLNEWGFTNSQHPVENVSWEAAVEFCQKLTAIEQAAGRLPSGWTYRLPTEAEWEYACRAGTTTRFSFGDSETQLGDYAWFKENAGRTHPVGEKPPNAWGLYDMHGNVWEWCEDWYGEYKAGAVTDPHGPSTGSFRVYRGGSWRNAAASCQSAFRYSREPTFAFSRLGFRLALSPIRASPRSADSEQAQPEPMPVNLASADQQTADSTNVIQPGTSAGEERSITDQKIKFCWCPPGEFLMGSPKSDGKASADERPQHRVILTQGFWLGKTPVTQDQWERVMGSNPSFFKGWRNPLEQVFWEEATDYCRKLTAAEQAAGRLPSGWSYRLPTEAEWEYACRAGTTTIYSFGDDESQLGDYAWFLKNSGETTHPVGEKQPNPWGFYDMHGNVWEWCEDWYGEYEAGVVTDPHGPITGLSRVCRGGCWLNEAGFCRSASRRRGASPRSSFLCFRRALLGFRLALGPSGNSLGAK